ncbi:MAG TPA: carbohydrate ABC transporter permease [Anaerolineales bacterium]|nr:carbohydrate ABC transporter permease [Anaerolineales bacterium]
MNPFGRLNKFLGKMPVHFAVILMCLLWIIPTLGLFVTSFRSRQAVQTTGWWTVFLPQPQAVGQPEYTQYCSSCHGANGKSISAADLTNPSTLSPYQSAASLLIMLRKPVNGKPHLLNPTLPTVPKDALNTLTPVLSYLQTLSGQKQASNQFTLNNYVDAIVGYKGTADYLTDCQQKVPSTLAVMSCNSSDLLNSAGIGIAFINTLIVVIPATILPIILAALAAYAFAWLDFKGRQWIFALLIGLQIVPLQMALVPIAQLYVQLGMQSTFLGVWLFHTGFGLPYAIYLMRNFIGSLPREIFESAYLDGANHWAAFRRLALPLAMPAIASLGIYQFLWVWNDFLVAKIFLTTHPVLTVQIQDLIDPLGQNWHILTGAAFLSFIVPMVVFIAFQRYFVRGLLAGSVKG